ncbi:MAG TPA: tryptophan--tRNA ligase, partial [Thermomicrobiales bacterium]|nr:tryptophan--tRNA ligase [Thermomicrobiales bacterium]
SMHEVEERYAGKGYGAFKGDLAELVVERLSPIQERLAALEKDPGAALRLLNDGAGRARVQAAAKMETIRGRMGIGSN